LIILYNDPDAQAESLQNAETRYVSKRDAFMAGLGIWDRFTFEIYCPLSETEFNDYLINNVRMPFVELTENEPLWNQYSLVEHEFEAALGQISQGLSGRRDDPEVMSAETTALVAFHREYSDILTEIEAILNGDENETVPDELSTGEL